MEFHQITYFAAVARTGNFSRAAEQCHVSQPSLSQQIKKLEEELGDPLFQRSRRGAQLTALGKSFLPRAHLILHEIAAAKDEAATLTSMAQGTVRIGAIPTVAPYLLPRLVEATSERLPGLQLSIRELTTDLLLRRLEEGELDFGLASPPFTPGPQLTFEHLVKDELLVALPSRHPLARRSAVRISDLENQPLVLLDDAHCLALQTRAFCEARGLQPTVKIESAQLDTAVALVASGQGLSLVPEMAKASLTHHTVRLLHLAPERAYRTVGLVWPSARILTRAQEGFLAIARTL